MNSSQTPLPDNTRNTHNRQTSMPPVGFETTIPASERQQTYALERAATGTGHPGIRDLHFHLGLRLSDSEHHKAQSFSSK